MKYLMLFLLILSSAFSLCTGPKFLGKLTGGTGKSKGLARMTGKRLSRGSIGGQVGMASGQILKEVIKAFGGGTPFGDDDGGDGQAAQPESFAIWTEEEITDQDLADMLTGNFKKRISKLETASASVKKPDQAGELLKKNYVPLVYDIVRLLKLATFTDSSDLWAQLIQEVEPVRAKLENLVKKDKNLVKKYPWIPTIDGFVAKLIAVGSMQPVDGAKSMTNWMQRSENGKNFYPTDKYGFVRVPGVMPPEFPTTKINVSALESAKKRFHKSGYKFKAIPQPTSKK